MHLQRTHEKTLIETFFPVQFVYQTMTNLQMSSGDKENNVGTRGNKGDRQVNKEKLRSKKATLWENGIG